MCMEPNKPINDLPEEPAIPLKNVYPMPRHSIKNAVMAQIAAERAAAAAEEKTAVSFRDRIRRQQAVIMKWGGMAACFMILCGVLIIASPIMRNTGNTAASQKAADCAETMAETAAYGYTAETQAVLFSVTADSANSAPEAAEDNGTTAPADVYSTASGEDEDGIFEGQGVLPGYSNSADETFVTANGAEKFKKPPQTSTLPGLSPVEETATEAPTALQTAGTMTYADKKDTGGYIKMLTAELVDESIYSAWLTENGYADEFSYSLAELVADFGIERAALTEKLDTHAAMVDMDALYSPSVKEALTAGKTPEELDNMVLLSDITG